MISPGWQETHCSMFGTPEMEALRTQKQGFVWVLKKTRDWWWLPIKTETYQHEPRSSNMCIMGFGPNARFRLVRWWKVNPRRWYKLKPSQYQHMRMTRVFSFSHFFAHILWTKIYHISMTVLINRSQWFVVGLLDVCFNLVIFPPNNIGYRMG